MLSNAPGGGVWTAVAGAATAVSVLELEMALLEPHMACTPLPMDIPGAMAQPLSQATASVRADQRVGVCKEVNLKSGDMRI